MSNVVKKFEIHLDHDIDEQYQYEPGEALSGNIFLETSEELNIKSIKLQIRGEAMVSLDEVGKTEDPLSASEIYVDETLNVLEEESGLSIEKGIHKYPFDFVLPSNLPSSFIGKYGSITYVVKATLKQGYENQVGLGSTITSEPFLVLNRYDLSKIADLNRPKNVRCYKNSKCSFLFCTNGEMEAEFSVAKTGFVPGEDIIINAQINNDYPQNISQVQASLVLHSSFHAKNSTKENQHMVNKKIDNIQIDYGSERTWTDLRLQVPPFIPESYLEGCVLIDIFYQLDFLVEFENGEEVGTSFPIIIGSPINSRQGKQWNEKNYPISTGNNFELPSGSINDVDIKIDKNDLEKFRHPMAEGEIKDNILFQED